MKLLSVSTAILLAIVGSQAMAEPAKTRAEVKAELAEAIRTGDILANGDSGLKLSELYPGRYPSPTMTAESGSTTSTMR